MIEKQAIALKHEILSALNNALNDPIFDPALANFIRTSCVVSGGISASVYHKEKINDIDLYCKTQEDLDKLKAYAKAQFNTIVELNKKLQRVEEELRNVTYNTNHNIELPKANVEGLSDEEIICNIQLDIIKKKSLNGEELTLDDAKRVETYTKILNNRKTKPTAPESKLSDEDL